MENDRDLLLVSVFTFLTVSLWIFFELVKTTKTTTVSSTVKQVVIPFSSNIDSSVFTIIKKRSGF